jgi:hypothetical protein
VTKTASLNENSVLGNNSGLVSIYNMVDYRNHLSLLQIRDLEARVELLSGGKDEAMGEMSNILKGIGLFELSLAIAYVGFRLNARKPNTARSPSRRKCIHRPRRWWSSSEVGMGNDGFHEFC